MRPSGGLGETLADADIANRPLSENWPLSENDAIEDTFAAAVAHAARAEVPAKPRQPYKLKRWVEKVKALRDLAAKIVSNRVSRDKFIAESKKQTGLRDWMSKVLLLEQTPRGQWKRMEFEVRGPSGGPYRVNKKGDSQYRALGTYQTVSDARDAIAEYNGLVAAWEPEGAGQCFPWRLKGWFRCTLWTVPQRRHRPSNQPICHRRRSHQAPPRTRRTTGWTRLT